MNLCLILGDQLNLEISSLAKIDKEKDVVFLAELMDEASYVKHHKKKLVFIFSAMRHFAEELKKQNYNVYYKKLTDPDNTHSFAIEISKFAQSNNIENIYVTYPGEYRVLKELEKIKEKYQLYICSDDRFFCSIKKFKQWQEKRKELVMEYFYRELRKEYKILLDDKNKPVGGKWNYDKENRKKITDKSKLRKIIKFKPDHITQEVMKMVAEKFPDNMGDAHDFFYAVTREQALEVFANFIANNLQYYGDYQDAMLVGEAFLFHSVISLYLNIGLLKPKEVCAKVEAAYHKGKAPLNAVEGFIRQVLGWREFIRGIYWANMPGYTELNYLEAKQALPDFYWSANTDLNCLAETINFTKKYAYSHHIQRLMVTGNFAILAGLDVVQVHNWYLAVYFDAYEWVEAPNTIGMSLFADGGIFATKPYISGGAYINRMSDFCRNCKYDVKSNDQENSCPFNYLYWNFLDKHQGKFATNRRMAIAYKNLNNFSLAKREKLRQLSAKFIEDLC